MKKRVCENCRFFLEAGFAKNGWCNNPQRKESSDMKIVVRRSELACRGTWANDLFVPRTDQAIPGNVVAYNDSSNTVPPARVEEVTFVMNGHREKPAAPENAASTHPVDVVVGQKPSTNPLSPPAERAPLLTHDNRSAILKARERHRARKAPEQRHVEPVVLKSSIEDEIDVVAPYNAKAINAARIAAQERPRRSAEVPPVTRKEMSRDFPTMTSFPEDDVRFMSVPEPISGIELPRRAAQKAPERPTFADDDYGDDTVVDHDMLSQRSSQSRDRRDCDRSYHEIEVDSVANEPSHSERMFENEGPTLYNGEASSESDQSDGEFDNGEDYVEEVPIFRQERRRFDFGGWRRSPKAPARPVIEEVHEYEAFHDESWEDDVAPVIAAVEQPVLTELEPYPDEVEDVVIAPEVPRMCRTCRDFRPGENGERGWCANPWAFNHHRRVVDAEDLPCETLVGVWWLPRDEVWLATADLSSHSQPTPLVDLWLSKVGQEGTEEVVERRRKRS